MKQKQLRVRLKEEVLKRDKNKCRVCGFVDGTWNLFLDPHHITDRKEMPNGGYVKENIISLCPHCHENAEVWHKTKRASWIPGYYPDDLYNIIKSSFKLAYQKSLELK